MLGVCRLMKNTKEMIEEVQKMVQVLGISNVPAVFSCIENAAIPEEDIIMHVALFGDMADCLFFMATILQKIMEKHVSDEMLKELGKARVRQIIFAQVESVYLTIQKNKKYEIVKNIDLKQNQNIDNVPFITQLIPKEKNDKKPDSDE